MNRLIYIIILLTSAIWFISCGSHRSNMKQDISTDLATESHKKDSASSDKKIEIIESDKATESVESYEVNYDTDKPVDPVTGKPPIKSEKWTGTNKNSDYNRQENIDNKENSISDESTFAQQKENVHLEASKQKDESNILKQHGWAGVGTALLIISCIIAWLVYKKKRKKNNQ